MSEVKPSIYLAASFYHSKSLMREYASVLRGWGFEVTSSWIASENSADPLNDSNACRVAAQECFDDIDAASLFVYFSEPASTGKNVELGYVLAVRLAHIVVIGPPTSVFHFLPDVTRFASWSDFTAWLLTGGDFR